MKDPDLMEKAKRLKELPAAVRALIGKKKKKKDKNSSVFVLKIILYF